MALTTLKVLLAASTVALSANSSAATYVFENPFKNDESKITLEVIDVNSSTQWTLSAFFDPAASGAFVRSLNYFYDFTTKLSPSAVSSSGATPQDYIATTSKSFTKTGVDFITANNSGRFTSGETIKWTYLGTNQAQFDIAGAKVQAYVDGGSLEFIQVPVTPVPEPETYAMMLLGLGVVGFYLRRKAKSFGAQKGPAFA